MLTEKEVQIIETLVEEEMSYLKSVTDDIATRYLTTLSVIVDKLKGASADSSGAFSANDIPVSV